MLLVDYAHGEDTKRSPRNAFTWIQPYGGFTLDTDYPYTGCKGECVKSKLKHYMVKITGFRQTDSS
jgi:hypothetical protein